jgi:nitroreductase
MKKFVVLMCLAMNAALCVCAQPPTEITLEAPGKTGGASVQEALWLRRSYRGGIDSRELPPQMLSELLWAANGVNRPDGGGRTAPSAIGAKDVDVYVVMPGATYRYDADGHRLNLVAEGDLRKAASGGQAFVETVPVVLLLVSDLSRFGERANSETIGVFAGIDVGVVSQNISLFCSGHGLATIPRAMMDEAALRTALKLTDSQRLLLNHAVGFLAE